MADFIAEIAAVLSARPEQVHHSGLFFTDSDSYSYSYSLENTADSSESGCKGRIL
jgi:hypothetical protein